MTGLLTRNFTLYYGVSDLLLGDPMINDINGTLGTVNIKDPIHTLQVKETNHIIISMIQIYAHEHIFP